MRNQTFEDAQEIRICRGDIDYRGIVEHINEGVVIVAEGKCVFANNAFYEISHRSPQQVLQQDFAKLVAPADRERVTQYLTERLFTEGISDRIEFVMPTVEGDTIIEMKVSVVECMGSPAILGALTSITERRKTRIELERVKQRLESILHSMNEVVVSMSATGYWVLAINPAAEALYGVPVRDFTSGENHIFSFVHPDDFPKVKHFYDNLPEAEFGELQYRIISGNNLLKWVHDEAHVVYSSRGTIRRIDHVIRDITEEKKAIDALRQSEEKYRDFFHSTSDMAFTLTPEGTFLDINEAGVRLLGFANKAEALSSNVEDFYVDLAERRALLEEIYSVGHVESKPVKLRNKSGEIIEVAITSRAKKDDFGRVLYHDGIAHNITKALEDQRNRVLRNAAGSLCHYLNTHLMHLLAAKDGIQEELEGLQALEEEALRGVDHQQVAGLFRGVIERIHDYCSGVASAYDRIAEVTKAFNQAFHYEEESYVADTILDIFKSYGYDGND